MASVVLGIGGKLLRGLDNPVLTWALLFLCLSVVYVLNDMLKDTQARLDAYDTCFEFCADYGAYVEKTSETSCKCTMSILERGDDGGFDIPTTR
jgi:hypothetical protein